MQLAEFQHSLKAHRGLSPATVNSYTQRAKNFLEWVAEQHEDLSLVSIKDVDRFFANKRERGWQLGTVATHCQALRAFFGYAAERGWCDRGMSRGIVSPRLPKYTAAPKGPSWVQVRQLIRSVNGRTPKELRARAMILLYAVYGLRSSEVARLRLDDFDWRTEIFTVRRAKRGGIQQYPIQYEVGEAILEYLQRGRARCACRHMFLTVRLPYRPLGPGGMWGIVGRQMKALNIPSEHAGPHSLAPCLRHPPPEERQLIERDRRVSRPSRYPFGWDLCEIRPTFSAQGRRIQLSGDTMTTFLQAVQGYVERKRSEGLNYAKAEQILLSLSRYVGHSALERVTVRQVASFLDGPKTSPVSWEKKYGLLRAFFDFWLARGEMQILPPAREAKNQPTGLHPLHLLARGNPGTTESHAVQSTGGMVPYRRAHRSHLPDLFVRDGRVDGRGAPAAAQGCGPQKRHGDDPRQSFQPFPHHSHRPRFARDSWKVHEGKTPARGGRSPFFCEQERRGSQYQYSLRYVQKSEAAFWSRSAGRRTLSTSAARPAAHICGASNYGMDTARCGPESDAPGARGLYGQAGLGSTERYLSLTPERFRTQLAKLSPSGAESDGATILH